MNFRSHYLAMILSFPKNHLNIVHFCKLILSCHEHIYIVINGYAYLFVVDRTYENTF